MKVSVGVSNRHVHLTEETYKELFDGIDLEIVKELTQPGQFASNLKLTIKTEKSSIENVRVLGPLRKYNQVEISKTDAFKLGLNPPVRDSGDLEGSSPITLEYNGKEVHLDKGCIIPTRHIHINPDEVEKFGLTGVKEVSVKVGGEKGGIFNHVRIKAANMSFFELHIDTDDANSFMIKQGDIVQIINEN